MVSSRKVQSTPMLRLIMRLHAFLVLGLSVCYLSVWVCSIDKTTERKQEESAGSTAVTARARATVG